MARFKGAEINNYGGQGGTGYFSLKNDHDVAAVRFMYGSVDDVEGYAVHAVEIDGRHRWVNCLRDYNQPLDDCPFCKAKMYQSARLFIPVYNIDQDKVQIWERGKKFFQKISSLCSRYPDLVSHTFEIERNGKSGDTQTTYEIYETGKDETSLEDLPELPEILGGVVLDKTADEMQYYLDNGSFPEADDMPVRRRGSKSVSENEEVPFEQSRRRTPAGNQRRDRF